MKSFRKLINQAAGTGRTAILYTNDANYLLEFKSTMGWFDNVVEIETIDGKSGHLKYDAITLIGFTGKSRDELKREQEEDEKKFQMIPIRQISTETIH